MIKRYPIGQVLGLLMVFSFSLIASAQGSCSVLVSNALATLDGQCDNLARNSVCYGYNRVNATFSEEVAEDFFSQPSDVASLDILQKIGTTPLDETSDQWGVALLNIQANVPNSLPGQSVLLLLLGDAELENAVTPDSAFVPAEPIDVVVAVGANVRSGAGTDRNTVGGATAGTVLKADALNPDKQWVRVAYGNLPAWISRSVLQENVAIDTLPVIEGTERTPMQAFYLRTGIGASECEEAPRDTLMVQSPKGIKVDLTVNGVDIRVGSTILIRNIGEDVMEIVVVDGEVIIPEGGEDGEDLRIRQGFRSTVCLDEPQDRGVDGESNDRIASCDWSEPEEVPQRELNGNWCGVREIPDGILNYRIEGLRCPGDPEPTPAPSGNTGNTGAVGTCRNFNIVSPNGGGTAFGVVTYSWTGVEGATNYIINFEDANGGFLTTQWAGNATSAMVDTAQLPVPNTRWLVVAMAGDTILCATPRSEALVRSAPPVAAPPPQNTDSVGFSISASCLTGFVKISWSNLETVYGAGVEIYIYGDLSGTLSGNNGGFVTSSTATYSGQWTISSYAALGLFPVLIC